MYHHALIDRTLLDIARARAAVSPRPRPHANLIRLLGHCRQRMRLPAPSGAPAERATS